MAREREADRKAGRPERGLFTGRGSTSHGPSRRRKSRPVDDHYDDEFDDDIDSDYDDEFDDDVDADFDDTVNDSYDDYAEVRGKPRGPRRGAKKTLVQAIRQLPSYIRLLIGLFGDSRVSRIDRFMVLATLAYIVSPLDFVPDIIPFFGQVDDMFLLVLSLQRLVNNAGSRVLRSHWSGNPRDLSDLNLAGMLSAAGFFLPSQLRRQLTRMANKNSRKR
jgi:uncharacterized membrane protein YkvA (DUF1232 family)